MGVTRHRGQWPSRVWGINWWRTALLCLAVVLPAAVWGFVPGATAAVGAMTAGSPPAPMPTARVKLAAVTGRDGMIYAIGGRENNISPVGTVERYDPTANTWNTEVPMPTARWELAAALGHDGKIYAIGGVDGSNQLLATVEAYDPVTNAWTRKAPMPSPRSELAAAAGPDGRIYAIGGFDFSPNTGAPPRGAVGTVEAYDPATNAWSAAPVAQTPLTVVVRLAHSRIKVGRTQTVTVVTIPTVRVRIAVGFPDGSQKEKTGTANGNGGFIWSFKQPPGKTKGTNHSARVTVTVTRGNEPPASVSAQYRIV